MLTSILEKGLIFMSAKVQCDMLFYRLSVVDEMTSVFRRQARHGKNQGVCARSQSIAVHYEVLLQVLLSLNNTREACCLKFSGLQLVLRKQRLNSKSE